MVFKDYYMILGLDTNRVSMEEIKNAFREQAKKYHPDVNKENKFAEERFKDINEAYKILSGSNTKRKYDRVWTSKIYKNKKKQNGKKENTSTFNEIINMFFGTTRNSATKRNKKAKTSSKRRRYRNRNKYKIRRSIFWRGKENFIKNSRWKNEKFFYKNTSRN